MGSCLTSCKMEKRDNNDNEEKEEHKVDDVRVNSLYRISVTQSTNPTINTNLSFEIGHSYNNSHDMPLDEELECEYKEEEKRKDTLSDNEIVTVNKLFFLNQNQSDYDNHNIEQQIDQHNNHSNDSDSDIFDGSSAELYENDLIEHIIEQTPNTTNNNNVSQITSPKDGEIDEKDGVDVAEIDELIRSIKKQSVKSSKYSQIEGDIDGNVCNEILKLVTNNGGETNSYLEGNKMNESAFDTNICR